MAQYLLSLTQSSLASQPDGYMGLNPTEDNILITCPNIVSAVERDIKTLLLQQKFIVVANEQIFYLTDTLETVNTLSQLIKANEILSRARKCKLYHMTLATGRHLLKVTHNIQMCPKCALGGDEMLNLFTKIISYNTINTTIRICPIFCIRIDQKLNVVTKITNVYTRTFLFPILWDTVFYLISTQTLIIFTYCNCFLVMTSLLQMTGHQDAQITATCHKHQVHKSVYMTKLG